MTSMSIGGGYGLMAGVMGVYGGCYGRLWRVLWASMAGVMAGVMGIYGHLWRVLWVSMAIYRLADTGRLDGEYNGRRL
jgi:hypothetical protein